MKKQIKLITAATAGLVISASSASAVTLITESFSGSVATDLVGTTTSDGNNWTGATTIQADGSLADDKYKSAYLAMPSAVVSGETYTIEASYTIFGAGATNEPLRIGLAVGNLDAGGDTDGGDQRPDASAFDIFVNSGGGWRTYSDSTGSEDSGGTITSWDQTMTIVLDTTNASDYTVSFYNGATQFGSTVALGSAIAFDHLWIGHERESGGLYFDNITVSDTQPVPEPTTTALLGLGGLALILRRRKG